MIRLRACGLAGLLFLCSFACAVQAGMELTWSHRELQGQEAQDRFLRDSKQCFESASILAPAAEMPGPRHVATVADPQAQRPAANESRREQVKAAMACMSLRGWQAKPY